MKNKSGVSAIIATVFLIMITIAAVAIIWGMVIPFIKGNLDLDQRKVDLKIITGTGYTVYDPEEKVAFIQVERGQDNVTLHGMELMIDFSGTTYKTTLRAPNPGSSKSYFFDMKSMNTLPKTCSVAPIFILDGRQVLGEITSQTNLPTLNIVKNYTDIIIELNKTEQEVINITEGNLTQDLVTYCPNTGKIGRDPWGGCPIAMGDIYSVYYDGWSETYFDFNSAINMGLTNKGIKFKGDNCVVKDNVCTSFNAIDTGSWTGKANIMLSDGSVLNQTMSSQGWLECTGNNWFYVYDNANCK